MEVSEKEDVGKKGATEITKLRPRSDPNSLLKICKNFGLKSLAWVGVYLLGYFNFSIGWMVTPLLFSVLRDSWKKEKRNRLAAARESALTNEQAMLELRMDAEDLPSWVFFPDKDRAEWVNTILKQLWPYVNDYVRNMLFNTVEPAVETALKAYKLSPFKFERERVFLGQVPPRITGVKVYDENVSRKEIIMDLDLVFASDLEVVFKVKGIPARVSEFGLRGTVRCVLKPLVSEIPLIGGVQVYFLKAPEIDYSLGGVGGVLEIPGLNKIVENIIIDQVKNFIVLPNKFTMPLAANILNKTLKCPDSAGVLRVKLIRAKNLTDKDGVGSGKSDPYVLLTVGAHTHRAPTIMDNLNPTWNLVYDFPIEVVQGQQLLLEFYDDDSRRDDEFLGRAVIQSSLVAERGHIEGYWVDLMDCDKGSVQVSLSWLPVTDDPKIVKAATKQAKDDDDSGKCLLHLYLDSCSGLVDLRDPSYKCSPVVQLINGHEVIRSWPKYYTNDPVIEQGFVMLISSPYTDEIRINVIDTAKKKSEEVIGTTSIRVWSLIDQPDMEYPLQPFLLKGNSPSAKINLSVSMRGLLPASHSSPRKSVITVGLSGSEITSGSESDYQPEGVTDLSYDASVREGRVKVTIHRAEDLQKMDITGKADPYVVVTYEEQKFKTDVCKKTLEPVWEHEAFLDVKEHGDNQIKIELFDRDKMGKDESMGITTVDVRRVSLHGTLSEVWDQLIGGKQGRIMWSMTFYPEVPDVPEALPLSPSASSTIPTPSYEPTPSPYKEEAPVKRTAEIEKPKERYEPTPQPYREENAVKRTGDIEEPEEKYSPTPSPYREENPVKRTGEIARPDLEQEMWNPDSEKELIRVKRDPQDCDEPSRDELSSFSRPSAPVDQLGYMGKVMPGFLRVTVHRAENLMDKDVGGKSDPYVVIKYASQVNKSKTVKNDLNPEFEFSTGYVIEEDGPADLFIELYDKDDIGKDDSLGDVKFDIRALASEGNLTEAWANLQNAKKGRVQLSLDYSPSGYIDGPSPEDDIKPFTRQIPTADIHGPPEDELRQRTGLRPVNAPGRVRLNLLYDERREELKVFVHEAANLPGGDLPDPPDPQVKLYLMPGKKKKKTQVVKDSVEPKFDEEFDFSIDYDKVPRYSLKISVVDRKGMFSKSPVLGSTTISLDNPGLRSGLANWYPLEDVDEDSD